MSILMRYDYQGVLQQLLHAPTNLMALVARRVTTEPADVAAERTRVLKPLMTAQGGSELDVTEVTPGAVVATTVVPARRASASTRINALYRRILEAAL